MPANTYNGYRVGNLHPTFPLMTLLGKDDQEPTSRSAAGQDNTSTPPTSEVGKDRDQR